MERANPSRFWIEILVTASAVAFAIALLIATLGAATAGFGSDPESVQVNSAPPASQAPPAPQGSPAPQDDSNPGQQKQVVDGMLTCSKCGAKHSAALGKNATDCVRTCAHLGYGFALIDGEKVYQLEGDLTQFKRLAARRVEVVGAIEGNTIRVATVTAE